MILISFYWFLILRRCLVNLRILSSYNTGFQCAIIKQYPLHKFSKSNSITMVSSKHRKTNKNYVDKTPPSQWSKNIWVRFFPFFPPRRGKNMVFPRFYPFFPRLSVLVFFSTVFAPWLCPFGAMELVCFDFPLD